MRGSRKQNRRALRVFQPGLDGCLEDRVLLSTQGEQGHTSYKYLLSHPAARNGFHANVPPFVTSNAPKFDRSFKKKTIVATQTYRGGKNVEVVALDGSHYMISLSYTSNTLATNIAEGSNGQNGNTSEATTVSQVQPQTNTYPQPIGVVRAYPMSNGRVGIIVDGSTPNTELTINPLGQAQRKGYASSYAYGQALQGHLLNIGQITINSGEIGSILGFQDSELSGPLTSMGTNAIDRIAFDTILPGASITTGGDVNTLDVLQGVDLSGSGTGIHIGRDLNLLNVGGDIDITNGATFSIGRFLGLVNQPPKGTGTGTNVLTLNFNSIANTTITVTTPPPVGSFIQGSLSIQTSTGSSFTLGATIQNTMYIEGSVTGFSGLLQTTNTAPTSPPFETRLTDDPTGFVTALGGETG
jgi:hypothetical protein